MVEQQIMARGIADHAVLAAMGAVPRERFVRANLAAEAYDDGPLPIGHGQTISQPYIVALMVEASGVQAGDNVLEVGAGSGYAAAVLGRIAGRVCAIERHRALGERAAAVLQELGCSNVEVRIGDGLEGWPEAQPFSAILVAAAGRRVPPALKAQLAIGGRLVMPLKDAEGEQRLTRIIRVGTKEFAEDDLGGVRFVPLVGG